MPEYNGNTYGRATANDRFNPCGGCAFENVDCSDPRRILGDCGRREIFVQMNETPIYAESELPKGKHKPVPVFDGEQIINALGGVKNDGGKVRPTLLVKSMPKALKEILEVLEHGAQKYGANNWKLVENERYHDAMLRHIISYFSGERHDLDSEKHHLAHMICCALFLLEKELEN